jgi:serine/threonine-protein kinase
VSSDPHDPLVGTVVDGRYRVLSRISEGGMGIVYRAEHVFLKREVALKRLHRELTEQKQAVARFEREAQAAARIDHPNVCQVLDCGVGEDGAFFIAMELLDGTALDARIARGPLPLPEAVEIGVQLCDALGRAHELGIVHRDLKPENVMLMPRRDGPGVLAKIMDFGIAKVAQEGDGKKLTQAGMIFGTPQYMAPEQAAGSTVDARADLYALGVMLFEMAAGRCPFQSENVSSLLMKHLTEPPPPLEAVAPHLRFPEPFRAVVFRCLEKDPDRRFPSAPALGAALRACAGLHADVVTIPPPSVAGPVVGPTLLAGSGTLVPRAGLPSTAGPLTAAAVAGAASYALPRRRSPWPWIVGSAVAAGLVALVVVLVAQGGADDRTDDRAREPRPPAAHGAAEAGTSPIVDAAERPAFPPQRAAADAASPFTLQPLFTPPDAPAAPTAAETAAALAAERAAFEAGDPELAAALALVGRNRLRQALDQLQLLASRLDGSAHFHFVLSTLLARADRTLPALDHALRAVELDARYAASVELLGLAGKALAGQQTQEPAARFLERALDPDTAAALARATLETFRSSQHARRVRDLLERRGLLAGLPPFLGLPLRVYGAPDCEARKTVLAELAAAPDPRMQPFLRRLKGDSGCGILGLEDCWRCEREAIRAALAVVDAAAKAAAAGAGADAGR